MDDAPETLLTSLAADGAELRVESPVRRTHGSVRRDHLDDVGAVRAQQAHGVPQIIGSASARQELSSRCEDARPGAEAAAERVPQGQVDRAAERLHGGEARVERPAGVLEEGRAALRVARGRAARAITEPAIRPEVPVEVHVDVNEAWQERRGPEIVRDRPRARSDTGDRASPHRQHGVGQHPTASVQQARGTHGDRVGGAGRPILHGSRRALPGLHAPRDEQQADNARG
jgi:hypothetical protein